jgi:23S rRNA (guanine2445-N2)-methyltransferase / 23S rRNA (guanine2069-N7)-methyltransferase
MSQLDLLATSTFGLEAVVVRELQALGYKGQVEQPGRIAFRGDHPAVARANLWLRSSDRVLLRVGAFDAEDFGALFDQTFALPWEEWLPRDAAFPVTGRSVKSQLSSVPACQKIVKKAVVEKLRAAHAVTELPETGAVFRVEIALLENRATLTLNTSGDGLHKRGYRPLSGATPLKETLAAGMLQLTFWRPERALLDPFCGTGTIPIEAALMGRNLAPGLHRAFVAESWPILGSKLWKQAREEARDLAKPKTSLQITGSDVDEKVLNLARHHCRQAGVSDTIRLKRQAFADLRSDVEYGCLVTNPPYGDRTDDRESVQRLYREMPDVLRRLSTWSHYILTSHRDFEQLIGQEADRRRKLYNGRIACVYFQFHGPRPETEAREAKAPPAFGGLTSKALQQGELFRSRLKKRAHHLRRWPKRGITCYRLYDRDIKEVPLIVDRYGDCLHLSEVVFPQRRTPAEQGDWLDLMARTAAEVMGIEASHVFVKRRERQRGTAQHPRISRQAKELVIEEAGLRFLVNLSDYIDTGLFLDHRITRGMVREAAQGKRFLNLFAYTGAFTVYAAAGGARSITSVELSKSYIAWAKKNMELNKLTGFKHHYVPDDAIQFLEKHRSAPTYDLAVVDPPTFSNSKKLEHDWDVQRDHVELLNRVLELMTPGGVVFFSTNFRRFKLGKNEIRAASIEDITQKTIPPDFRNKKAHRCWRICRGI